jgi:hypothetical protein
MSSSRGFENDDALNGMLTTIDGPSFGDLSSELREQRLMSTVGEPIVAGALTAGPRRGQTWCPGDIT